MDIQWIPYKGLAGSIQNDLEALMLYSESWKGVAKTDIYQYVSCLNFIYSKLLAVATNKPFDEVASEVFHKNSKFYEETIPEFFKNDRYLGISKTVELFSHFMVPNLD